jgi:hypothetical protein
MNRPKAMRRSLIVSSVDFQISAHLVQNVGYACNCDNSCCVIWRVTTFLPVYLGRLSLTSWICEIDEGHIVVKRAARVIPSLCSGLTPVLNC